jgi:hypothetical protein
LQVPFRVRPSKVILNQLNRSPQWVFGELKKIFSWPMKTILLSICLGHGKMIGEILGKLNGKKT